jgi:hypothetical protein
MHDRGLTSSKTSVDNTGAATVLTLSNLSLASQYHLDSRLAYGEVRLMNSAAHETSKSKVSQSLSP